MVTNDAKLFSVTDSLSFTVSLLPVYIGYGCIQQVVRPVRGRPQAWLSRSKCKT